MAFPDQFEDQNTQLTFEDMACAVALIKELDALMYFNQGSVSGASVLHKHMQFIPRDILGPIPVETAYLESDSITAFASLKHKFQKLDTLSPSECYQAYQSLREALQPDEAKGDSYNLLMTDKLMWMVMRDKNSVFGDGNARIDVNSMGFAGTLFVKNPESLELLKHKGPAKILQEVAAKL